MGTDISLIIGIISVIATLFGGGLLAHVRDKKRKESCSASLLYNDLKSIERYFLTLLNL